MLPPPHLLSVRNLQPLYPALNIHLPYSLLSLPLSSNELYNTESTDSLLCNRKLRTLESTLENTNYIASFLCRLWIPTVQYTV